MKYLLEIMPWIAIICLPLGYWKQVWHIHIHKEVRDLNLTAYILFAVSYMFLGMEAYIIDSTLFLLKNVLVAIPTLVLIGQIIYHRDDKWIDNEYVRMAEKGKCPRNLQMHKRININKRNIGA